MTIPPKDDWLRCSHVSLRPSEKVLKLMPGRVMAPECMTLFSIPTHQRNCITHKAGNRRCPTTLNTALSLLPKRRFLEEGKGGRCGRVFFQPSSPSPRIWTEGAAGKTAGKGKGKGLLSYFIWRTCTTQAGWSLTPPDQVTTDAALCKRQKWPSMHESSFLQKVHSACYFFGPSSRWTFGTVVLHSKDRQDEKQPLIV